MGACVSAFVVLAVIGGYVYWLASIARDSLGWSVAVAFIVLVILAAVSSLMKSGLPGPHVLLRLVLLFLLGVVSILWVLVGGVMLVL